MKRLTGGWEHKKIVYASFHKRKTKRKKKFLSNFVLFRFFFRMSTLSQRLVVMSKLMISKKKGGCKVCCVRVFSEVREVSSMSKC